VIFELEQIISLPLARGTCFSQPISRDSSKTHVWARPDSSHGLPSSQGTANPGSRGLILQVLFLVKRCLRLLHLRMVWLRVCWIRGG
jgi:hypothetical protein